MNQNSLLAAIIAVCAVLLIVGFVFSALITDRISTAAHREATQHAPVPTPPALAHPKPAPAHA